MKKLSLVLAAAALAGLFACQKNNESSPISLSASTTTAKVGDAVTVTLTSSANASSWTVSPTAATQTYGVTTSKVNRFTFNTAGVYTVAVATQHLAYDSAHQSLDSCWHHSPHHCQHGVDSASLKITVVP